MTDFASAFHTGFLVRDVQQAMQTYGDALGLEWAEPAHLRDQPFWTPDQGMIELDLEVTYSLAGPHYVEIQRGPPGTFYDPAASGAHHVGLWCDDLPTEVSRLEAQGWQTCIAHTAPEDGFGLFVYLRPPVTGLLVELVNPAFRPILMAWLAGEASLG